MYSVLPSYALGFHGCDQALAERIFAGKAHLKRSKNDYDWLGEGIYFWENSPARAMQYAVELMRYPRKTGPKISKPAVVGAVIEWGYCLNLLDAEFLGLLRESFEDLRTLHQRIGVALPENKRVDGELKLRRLDCAVINALHQTRIDRNLKSFDTVRAAFAEGGPLFENSGIATKHHIQLCVRRRSSIKGYFRPMTESRLPTD